MLSNLTVPGAVYWQAVLDHGDRLDVDFPCRASAWEAAADLGCVILSDRERAGVTAWVEQWQPLRASAGGPDAVTAGRRQSVEI